MEDASILRLLSPYTTRADSQLCSRIKVYLGLLLAWNRKIALTTITSPDDVIKLHFGESLLAIDAVPVEKGRLADVGSGAGFPGLPLAMALTDLQVTLIESNSKKAAFLSEVIRILELKNALVERNRMEDLDRSAGDFDFISARALGGYQKLADWAKNRLTSSGKIALWLGDEDASEVSCVKHWNWRPPTRIPNSRNRSLLVGALR
jgi:16S rRNA (guanine527-N7)-methyltransferase